MAPTPTGAATEEQQVDEAAAAGVPTIASAPAARYIAAGVLSIVAVALALAIAVVAQPRRPRRTH